MEIFFFLVFVGAIVAIAVSRHAKALNEAWEEVARRLDLQYTGGNSRSLQGTRPALQLLIQAKTVGKSQWTDYAATFKKALPVEMTLKPQGFFSEMANSLFSRVDIEIGDPVFDSGVVIEGRNPAAVREYLDPVVVNAIKRLIAQFDTFEITQTGIRTERKKVSSNAALLTRDIELLEQVARILAARGESEEEAPAKMPPPIPGRETVPVPPPLPDREGEQEIEEPATEPEPVFDSAVESPEEEPPVPVPEPAEAMEPAELVEPMKPLEMEIDEEPSPAEKDAPCLVVGSWLEDFSEASSHYEFVKIFEERWKDTEVEGEATLKSVQSFSMDRIFGRGPGVRLLFDLGEMENGESLVLVASAEPEATVGDLRSRVGEAIPFAGTLIRCDAFERTLFLQVPRGEGSVAQSYTATYSPASTVLSSTVSSDPSR